VYRFLLSPRWLRLVAGAVLVAACCVALGLWQLDRLAQRHARNDLVRASLRTPPVDVERLLAPERPLPGGLQWRRVEVTGRYDAARTLLVRNRPLEGAVGYHVLVPLVTRTGPALLVDRGWVRAGDTARTRPAVPPPPRGDVTVLARLRASEPADGKAAAPTGEVRRIDVPAIAATLPYPVYGAFGEATRERPAPGAAPRRLPAPEVEEGPHLAYAFQWFVFAAIALVGVGVLARREAHPSAGTPAPPVRATAARY
jgi:cytochrome oxidase assembly protein ShyY1